MTTDTDTDQGTNANGTLGTCTINYTYTLRAHLSQVTTKKYTIYTKVDSLTCDPRVTSQQSW